MALSKGRKSTAKKKTTKVEVVESPVEVVEPVVEETAPDAESINEPEPVVVEEPALPEPPPPMPEPEPAIEEVKAEEPPPAPALEVSPEVEKVEAPAQIGIGSKVIMPSGQEGIVTGISPRGQFIVNKLSNTRRSFNIKKEQLKLVK